MLMSEELRAPVAAGEVPTNAAALRAAVAPLREKLQQHPGYVRLDNLATLRRFMEHHVFAVWDFMSLLKALQARLTCVEVPWVPRGDTEVRRLINEIVLGEETDEQLGGGYASHLEMYLEAMRQTEADTRPIVKLLERISSGATVEVALRECEAPEAAAQFVRHTFTILSGSTAGIAAAFAIGREEIIPEMFLKMVAILREQYPDQVELLLHYLQRHIELDGSDHAPMAGRMLEMICGKDRAQWAEALRAAESALQARLQFWNAILRA